MFNFPSRLSRNFIRSFWRGVETAARLLIWPANQILARLLAGRYTPRSVLHICYPVHIVHYTVVLLRRQGYKADYMAMGDSEDWTECDYRFRRYAKWMPLTLTEFWWFWRIVARYGIIHMHFMMGISQSGWEWPILKRMGRKIVVYYGGCEVRDRDRNMMLHPGMNICEECDYNAAICTNPVNLQRQRLSKQYADLELVTTPDMLDFVSRGIHFPFFSPPEEIIPPRRRAHWPENGYFRIVHVTNHPGIEGTRYIEAAVGRLKAKGYPVEFVLLKGIPYRDVLAAFADADLAIGKMKMGYYANAQIEAMCCGTPTITYVRPEFMTEELKRSALLCSTMGQLDQAIEHLITHPEKLKEHRTRALESIRRLHDNGSLAHRLIATYDALQG